MLFGHSDLEDTPQIFNRIHIRRLARPLQNLDAIVLEPFGYLLGSMTGSPILLKYFILEILSPVKSCNHYLRPKGHTYALPRCDSEIHWKSFVPRCLFKYI